MKIGNTSNPHRSSARALVAAALIALGGVAVVPMIHDATTEAPTEQAPAKLTRVELLLTDGFEGEAGGGAPVPPSPDICPEPPAGFSEVRKTWESLFAWGYPCGRMALCEKQPKPYPTGQAYPAPIGANRGTYVVVPFTANAGQSVNLYFDQVQSRPQIGYNQRPARGMLFTISPCAGDFRPPDITSSNGFLQPRCRMFENGGSLIWAASDIGACHTPPGMPLFLNIIPADPAGGIEPGESACELVPASASGCDVGAVTSTGPG